MYLTQTIETISDIGETQIVGQRGSRKCEVITTSPNAQGLNEPKKFVFWNNYIDQLAGFSVGDKVRISFTINGGEYQGKVYCNLQAQEIYHEDRFPEQNRTRQQTPPWNTPQQGGYNQGSTHPAQAQSYANQQRVAQPTAGYQTPPTAPQSYANPAHPQQQARPQQQAHPQAHDMGDNHLPF